MRHLPKITTALSALAVAAVISGDSEAFRSLS